MSAVETAAASDAAARHLAARADELREKHGRLRELLDARGARSIVLDGQPSLAWLLAGARVHVSLAAPPIAHAVVDHDGITVHTTANERARLVEEELPPGIEVVAVPWHEVAQRRPTDSGQLRESAVEHELAALRRRLLPAEHDRYRALGADAAKVVGDVLRAARPEDSEALIAARVAAGIVELGAEPLVTLVAGAGRVAHRHPLPGTGPLGRRAMVVVCARRRGLIANLTRWVRFDEAPRAERDAERRILDVEAAAFAALVPGRPYSEVFDELRRAYAAHGFDRDEWGSHHQGGPAGYAGRDPRLGPGVAGTVEAGQAFTLNPSAPGVKVEDTVLVTGDLGQTVEPITVDAEWPSAIVAGIARPLVLER
ncbi:M24 family metallopeptidase [Agromyces sp. CCNWLW203]|uniref:M24 family metallopeptidase n=1 Tax=Agromyces sp. CCNWLW203 TaxID=3112842 RepID=UPI002F96B840